MEIPILDPELRRVAARHADLLYPRCAVCGRYAAALEGWRACWACAEWMAGYYEMLSSGLVRLQLREAERRLRAAGVL